MFLDLPLADLRNYRPPRSEPTDFDAFWSDTIAESRSASFDPVIESVLTGHIHVDTFDVTFPGFAGQPVKAWLRIPIGDRPPLPAVIEFIGYGGGRGSALEPTVWSSLGYVHLVMDSRGQSTGYGGADTSDGGIDPQVGGVLTRGIGNPLTYYYRRLYTDAVRALDFLRELPQVDEQRVVACGGSQGGALAIAAAALGTGTIGVCVDSPFLSGIRRATQLTDSYPYREISDYLQHRRESVEAVFHTLDYVDCVNLAPRVGAPVSLSVALMDVVCPPSTAFAVFNHWDHPEKHLTVWEYNGHEGGGMAQLPLHVRFAAALTTDDSRSARETST